MQVFRQESLVKMQKMAHRHTGDDEPSKYLQFKTQITSVSLYPGITGVPLS